jgi:hypothetical protein
LLSTRGMKTHKSRGWELVESLLARIEARRRKR